MKWTTKKPTQPGWYWVRVSYKVPRYDTTYCVLFDEFLELNLPCDGYEWEPEFDKEDISHYYGPIEPPEFT